MELVISFYQGSNSCCLACMARAFACCAILPVLGAFLTCLKPGQLSRPEWESQEDWRQETAWKRRRYPTTGLLLIAFILLPFRLSSPPLPALLPFWLSSLRPATTHQPWGERSHDPLSNQPTTAKALNSYPGTHVIQFPVCAQGQQVIELSLHHLAGLKPIG